jgi:hypothetical protein
MMHWFLGIDDTDNLESRGTGHLARMLGLRLEELRLAQLRSITRHQLLVSPLIPYTSHNSSACLRIESTSGLEELAGACREFLLRESAAGSDVGLCLTMEKQASQTVQIFGGRAKVEVLKKSDALDLAGQQVIFLEGLTGTGGGVIGALAGVGLCAAGNDGRFLWLPGLRELQGVYSSAWLIENTHIDAITNLNGQNVPSDARIDIGDWPRPLLRGGHAVLLVEEEQNHEFHDWHILAKETLKQLSN